MDPVSFLPALGAILLALLTTKLITVIFKFDPEPVKYLSIDGLRGYLAFFVFLHHSAIWYFYLRNNMWDVPPSNLYTHFGHSGVALFFMITGFLFFSKLIDSKEKGIDWIKLYVSRVMRLLPLYLVAIIALVFVVFALSHFVLREDLPTLIKKIITWMSFTIVGKPDMNGVEHTPLIMASVTWSLVYEWLFYFSLPLFALMLFRIRSPILIFIFSILAMAFITYFNYWYWINLSCFLGGVVAAFLVRDPRFSNFASGKLASVLIIVCLTLSVGFFKSSYSLIPLALISLSFILIACGNDLFGLLSAKLSRALGQMAYSIYLLHGIILFVCFNFVVGRETAQSVSVLAHWMIIWTCVPVLIFICYFLHIYVELPGMNASGKITARIKKLLNSK